MSKNVLIYFNKCQGTQVHSNPDRVNSAKSKISIMFQGVTSTSIRYQCAFLWYLNRESGKRISVALLMRNA